MWYDSQSWTTQIRGIDYKICYNYSPKQKNCYLLYRREENGNWSKIESFENFLGADDYLDKIAGIAHKKQSNTDLE